MKTKEKLNATIGIWLVFIVYVTECSGNVISLDAYFTVNSLELSPEQGITSVSVYLQAKSGENTTKCTEQFYTAVASIPKCLPVKTFS